MDDTSGDGEKMGWQVDEDMYQDKTGEVDKMNLEVDDRNLFPVILLTIMVTNILQSCKHTYR